MPKKRPLKLDSEPQSSGKSPDYSAQEEIDRQWFSTRKEQLFASRKMQFGQDMEALWRQADADYLPHRLGTTGKKKLVEDWRSEVSTFVVLDKKNEWRSREALNNVYRKVQSALALLIDRPPGADFIPDSKKYTAASELYSKLYDRAWADNRIGSKKELRKFIFNLAKYGWSVARRYHKCTYRTNLQMIKDYDPETKKFTYESRDKKDMDDVFFEAKSPWSCWIDDMAKPDDPTSRRDWMWKEIYDIDALKTEFKNYPRVSMVVGKSVAADEEENKGIQQRHFTSTNLAEVYFYENRIKDRYIVEANGVMIVDEPLSTENKELSLVDTYWTLRNIESPFGIGINEIMRGNKILLDRMRNMTLDQMTLSIYKMFFFAGSEQLDDEGGEQISVSAGKGVKVIDPKNISWLDVPGPGADAYKGLEMLSDDIDEDTGISKTLEGDITGKTAFEIAQAKEASLKRLRVPLVNIQSALEWDAYLTQNLMRMIYSEPEVHRIADEDLIQSFLDEVNNDQELYFTNDDGSISALEYREFQLELQRNQDGSFEGAANKQFFMLRPSWMEWMGQIHIRIETILAPSRELEKQTKLEMSNLIIPIIGQMAANPTLVPVYIKPVKQILKIYNESPRDWLPDEWSKADQMPMQPQMPPPPPGGPMAGPAQPGDQNPASMAMQGPAQPQQVIPSTAIPQGSEVSRASGAMGAMSKGGAQGI